ncbi:MAG TPA: amidohydrolase family protein [Bryobacteraceae bacterium]|nr:amidohydrolase family protein [Bryobacteraceae bacterium]
MLIRGARVATSSARSADLNLWIHNGIISFSPIPAVENPILNLEGFLILPGLINGHDHLELNLFPKLGCGPYPNASAWAQDIYRPHEPPIREHLALPKVLRLRWGAIKNLVAGVTTVAHHNAFHPVFLESSFPVRVVRRYGWAHSIYFSPDWKSRFENTPPDYPFIIHAAEGTDRAARREVQILANAGALTRSTILVHGVGVNRLDLPIIEETGAGIVWCPTSNNFTLRRSLDRAVLNSAVRIVLGSDSAITADGDLLDELHFAHRTVDAHRLYGMVTSESANLFKLPTGFGTICHEGPADLIAMKDDGQTPAMTLMQHYPEMVMISGRVRLISSAMAKVCPTSILNFLQPLEVEGRGEYLVAEDISSMLKQTTSILQQPPRLAGKAMAA